VDQELKIMERSTRGGKVETINLEDGLQTDRGLLTNDIQVAFKVNGEEPKENDEDKAASVEVSEVNEDDVGEENSIDEKQREIESKIVKGPNDFLQKNLINPVLFTRGVDCDHFYFILSGKVMVVSGNEGFMVEQTSFNFLGADSLIRDDYRPDFSAKVISNARLLKITRMQYRKAISSIAQSKSNPHTPSLSSSNSFSLFHDRSASVLDPQKVSECPPQQFTIFSMPKLFIS